ncbi:MAG TPA: PH domain-containing protein [Nitrospira sp.]|nr:PH domain-containing protein [Nitrospira sp.]
MSYIDDNLITGEHVVFRTHLHWKIFLLPALLLSGGIALMALAIHQGIDPYLSLLILLVPVWSLFSAYLGWRCSEFAVTDKRVLIKTGIVSRHTLETLLTKVENIGVEQTLWGRLFNYGTLYVTGTGSTREIFPGIHAPLEFRKAIEAAAVAFEERRPSGRRPADLA